MQNWMNGNDGMMGGYGATSLIGVLVIVVLAVVIFKLLNKRAP